MTTAAEEEYWTTIDLFVIFIDLCLNREREIFYNFALCTRFGQHNPLSLWTFDSLISLKSCLFIDFSLVSVLNEIIAAGRLIEPSKFDNSENKRRT